MINRLTDYRGREYYTELRRILGSDEGQAIVKEAETVKEKTSKLTPFDICVITLNHSLQFKAVCEWLEENKVMPTGSHERLMARGFKVREALQIASERMEKVSA